MTNEEREAERIAHASHDLYRDGDADIPDNLLDRNGQVALGQCKRCRRGEIELAAHCDTPFGEGKFDHQYDMQVEVDGVKQFRSIAGYEAPPYSLSLGGEKMNLPALPVPALHSGETYVRTITGTVVIVKVKP